MSVLLGDCIDQMRAMPAESVDAIVTDPPYGIGFMGHEWDQPQHPPVSAGHGGCKVSYGGAPHPAMESGRYDLSATANRRFQAWSEAWATEALRILKPGGHLLSFSSTRTYHRMVAGIEDAGFEIRDTIAWMFGSGFPKSKNLDGDRAGWGTALKPGFEPIVVARKPLTGTVAENVAEHGTGALNIDACRVGPGHAGDPEREAPDRRPGATNFTPAAGPRGGSPSGRWPANVVLDDEAGALLDEQTGELSGKEAEGGHRRNGDLFRNTYSPFAGGDAAGSLYGDRGGASRFFYCAKASTAERNAGLDGLPMQAKATWSSGDQNAGSFQSERTAKEARNVHPTVKPIALMRWLVRLVAPPGAVILDPFTGSGTTGIAVALEGFEFIGIERDADYVALAEQRIQWWRDNPAAGDDLPAVLTAAKTETERAAEYGLADLFTEAPWSIG